jgi:putative oxidoreductase
LAITAYELGAGSLLLFNRGVRWAASGLAVIVATGIWLIHRHNGWFVGEHGTGGSEYSVALLAMLLVIAADDATRTSRPIPSSREADPT